jgi:hypothetical protein
MFSKIKSAFKIKNQRLKKSSDTDVSYGQVENLICQFTDRKIKYSVGKKYPTSIPKNAQGETVMFWGYMLTVNLLWKNIEYNEDSFLKGLCDGMSINMDKDTGLIQLIFIFSGRPVIVYIADDAESVKNYINVESDVWSANFIMIEENNKVIKRIRQIILPKVFHDVLCVLLKNYKQPDKNILQAQSKTFELSDFNEAAFRWLYDKSNDAFIFVPEEMSLS